MLMKKATKKEKVTSVDITSKKNRIPKTVAMVTKLKSTSLPSRPVVKQPVLARKNKQAPMKTTYGASFGKPAVNRTGSGSGRKAAAIKYLESVGRTTGESNLSSEHAQDRSRDSTFGLSLPVHDKCIKSDNTQHSSKSIKCASKECNEDSSVQGSEYKEQESSDEGDFVERARRELVRISNERKEILSKKQEKMKRDEKDKKADDSQAPEPTVIVKENKVEKVESEKPFLLVQEGHTLTLPLKYRKIKSLHSKLMSQLHKNPDAPGLNYADKFVTQLENQFDWLNEISHNTVRNQAETLMNLQQKIILRLKWVIDRSISMGNSQSSFSWQSVYKCYRHWQVLLGQFRELQNRSQDLLTAELYLQRCCPCGGCLATRQLSSHFSSIHKTQHEPYPTPGCSLFSTWLEIDQEQEDKRLDQVTDVKNVTYTSERELRMLNETLHELQTSEMSLYIQRHVGSKALQVLERLDPTDRWFIPLYRGLWGLVCGEGKAFPSLVLDNTTD